MRSGHGSICGNEADIFLAAKHLDPDKLVLQHINHAQSDAREVEGPCERSSVIAVISKPPQSWRGDMYMYLCMYVCIVIATCFDVLVLQHVVQNVDRRLARVEHLQNKIRVTAINADIRGRRVSAFDNRHQLL